MPQPLVSVDSSEIHEGKLDELKAAMKKLLEFVDANEPLPIAYHMYLNEDGTRMTVIQVHPDSASMELHMEVAAPVFRGFSGLLTLSRVDVYGEPSEKLLEQLRQKSRTLGNAPVAVHHLHEGFTRLGSAS
jgi:quinol monooxygenase YgiN